jgi:hypothetical protein
MGVEMRRLILLALCAASCTILLGNTEANAFGRHWYRSIDFGWDWYRTWDGDFAVHWPNCSYRFPSPYWNYEAAYYRTYPRRRAYAPRYRAYSNRCCCR